MDLIIEPTGERWLDCANRLPHGSMLGRSQADWRTTTRGELGLAVDRPVIATGHQTLLWHPGILAKYFAARSFADAHGMGLANLIVDQHVEGFGSFDVPIRRDDGALAVRRLELTRPRKDVPMACHEAFTPPPPPDPAQLNAALPSVAVGVQRIYKAVRANRHQPNAAMQMAGAIEHLMSRWSAPLPNISSSMLIRTTLGQAILRAMLDDPQKCAASYNRAVSAIPEAGIGTLAIRDDYVELPLWRIGPDKRRIRAYDADVEQAMDVAKWRSGDLANRTADAARHQITTSPDHQITVLPRALFMTALVRLGMCDLFIHGTGGANYDRAMELWIRDWLGVEVGAIAVVSATLRLPLMNGDGSGMDSAYAASRLRDLWHDPMHPAEERSKRPAQWKQEALKQIDGLPRNSSARKAAFLSMHEQLATLRHEQAPAIDSAQQAATLARRHASDQAIAQRRDWAFPLYPEQSLDQLHDGIRTALAGSRA